MAPADVQVVESQVAARLSSAQWRVSALSETPPHTGPVPAATEIAVFALNVSGKGRQARRAGKFGRLVRSFALAACIALTTGLAACDTPSASNDTAAVSTANLPTDTASSATIAAPARTDAAIFSDLLLIDAGSAAKPWAVAVAPGDDTPILIDRATAGMDSVGTTYRLAARPVSVGTRDGASQFLDPLAAAESTGTDANSATGTGAELVSKWGEDERYLAAARAIAGQPIVLDAAYNAAAAVAAGGTHTYLNGIVLRVEADNPVVQIIDKSLLESGRPTRAEDVVYVAIRQSEQSLYDPGQVVNLRDVVVDQQKTDVDGQQTTVNVVNAALNGARVEPIGRVDLQSLLQPRLQRVDQNLSAQGQELAAVAPDAAAPQATATPAPQPGQPVQQVQPTYVNAYRGPSFVDDFLIWMWLSHSGFYRGPSVVINNPPFYAGRPTGDYYYSAPPSPSTSTPATVASSQAASRSTALQAARTSVSGQSSGTGGGVAATNKSAADASARVSAATSKSASVAGAVSAASAGKSVSSVPSNSAASAASRSAGSTAASARASTSSSSSSGGGKGIGGSSGSSSSGSSGFGGKGGSSGGASSSS